MITIKLIGGTRNLNLVRPDGDAAWLATPIGCAGPAGSGPAGETCASCAHFDLAESRWSDRGKASFCFERKRLSGKAPPQEVPAKTPACNRHLKRADAAAAVAFAEDRLGEQIRIKREQIERLRQSSKRLEDEIRELQRMRADPGVDVNWRNFEPVGPDEGT